MLKKLRKRVRGQSTAEYAILISLVVAAVIAMQTYAKRALQARIRGAATYMTNQMGNRTQYEPYYLQSNFEVSRDQLSTTRQDTNLVGMEASTNVARMENGVQRFTYDNSTQGQ